MHGTATCHSSRLGPVPAGSDLSVIRPVNSTAAMWEVPRNLKEVKLARLIRVNGGQLPVICMWCNITIHRFPGRTYSLMPESGERPLTSTLHKYRCPTHSIAPQNCDHKPQLLSYRPSASGTWFPRGRRFRKDEKKGSMTVRLPHTRSQYVCHIPLWDNKKKGEAGAQDQRLLERHRK